MIRVTTPFDDPQAELAWMFLQNLSADGDLDEGFDLLSDDFTYWNNATRRTCDKAQLRRIAERIKSMVTINFEMISCLNEGENVVIEAQPDGVTNAGVRYDTPDRVHLRNPRRAHHLAARVRRHPAGAAEAFGYQPRGSVRGDGDVGLVRVERDVPGDLRRPPDRAARRSRSRPPRRRPPTVTL